MVRLAPEAVSQLETAAQTFGQPQWRVVVDAIAPYAGRCAPARTAGSILSHKRRQRVDRLRCERLQTVHRRIEHRVSRGAQLLLERRQPSSAGAFFRSPRTARPLRPMMAHLVRDNVREDLRDIRFLSSPKILDPVIGVRDQGGISPSAGARKYHRRGAAAARTRRLRSPVPQISAEVA